MTARNSPSNLRIMLSPTELRALVDRHLEETRTPPSTFGLKAVGDPNFVRNLRAGREPRSRIRQKVVEFIEGVERAPVAHQSGAAA